MKTPLITLAAFTVLFLLERLFPLRQTTRVVLGRLLVNFVMSAVTFAVAMILVKPAALRTLQWSTAKPFGLLQTFSMPEWLQWLAAFLSLDLAFYYWHVLNHRVPFFWRFHNVHHFDPNLDVSTGFRFHFGEVAMSAAFRVVQVAFIGPSLAQFLAYEVLFQVHTLFEHSNWRLPPRFELALNLLFVTPRMHGIHHSHYRDETNSNYSVVFSFWDRLHRTLQLKVAQHEITIGIPGYSDVNDNQPWFALTAPFRKQRSYWTASTVTRPPSPVASRQNDTEEVSE
jgi:sterol desaturase/sphingolipid hydroxylase (fatty acid hydroxylase superfamily)